MFKSLNIFLFCRENIVLRNTLMFKIEVDEGRESFTRCQSFKM